MNGGLTTKREHWNEAYCTRAFDDRGGSATEERERGRVYVGMMYSKITNKGK